MDSTTAISYGAVSEGDLLQLGHSKDHRPDLPQLKIMLATRRLSQAQTALADLSLGRRGKPVLFW